MIFLITFESVLIALRFVFLLVMQLFLKDGSNRKQKLASELAGGKKSRRRVVVMSGCVVCGMVTFTKK